MDHEALEWTEGGPRSRRFGDVYYSAEDGLAESRAVFLRGCNLPAAWAGRQDFVVGELGFGVGLNVLALLELWRNARPRAGRLYIFSVEAFPIAREDAARALARWPDLGDLAKPLLQGWPRRPGFHRIDWRGLNATLDLAVSEARTALVEWRGAADAWFLDGFAPSRNPEMWREDLLRLVRERSAPGARAATFTVAGSVRRGLAAAGFVIERRPGFGAKRERLEARLPNGPHPSATGTPSVAIVGGGIAAAALSRAFRLQGVSPRLIAAPHQGASHNPAALVTPRLDAGGGPVATLHAQAFDRAVRLYDEEVPEAVIARGVLQLERAERDAGRFDRLATWNGFASGGVARLSPAEVATALQEPVTRGALELPEALTVEPAPILHRWLDGETHLWEVGRIERVGAIWRLHSADGAEIAEADIVCLAAGPDTAKLTPTPLRPVRGQVSWASGVECGPAAAWGGYAVPLREGVLFGATHDRDDWDVSVRTDDDRRNLELLAAGRPSLAARTASADLSSRASLRAATPDHLPLAGALEAGLFVLSGLGGRGFTLAPILGEEVAARALDRPSPLPRTLAGLVDPGRFGRADA